MRSLLKTLVLICCSLFFISSAFAADKTYELKLQTYYSPGNIDHVKKFADDVEKATNGKVKIKVYAGGELVSSPNILKSVRSGMIDIALSAGFYFTEQPTGDIEAGLPLAWTSPEEAQAIFDEGGLSKVIDTAYAKHGIKYLSSAWAGPVQFLTKTPVNSLDDLRKLKIRAGGGMATMLKSLGVSTVSMPPEDIYLALTTGQIDGCLYGCAFEYELTKYYEAAPYLNETPMLDPFTDSLFINQRLWESMPKDIQDAIMQEAKKLQWEYCRFGQEENKKAMVTIFKDKVTSLPEADVMEMTKAAQKVWEEEAKKGPENAKAVEIITEYAKKNGRLK